MKRIAMLGVLSLGVAVSASAEVVDDFNTPGLGEYTLSKILDQGDGTSNISFSDAAGTIDVTSAGTSGAEQVLLLRGDRTLAQGEELQLSAPTTFNNRDFGLAVGETPSDLGATAGDTRTAADFLFISWRTLADLNTRGFNGNGELTLVQAFGENADTLFIARLANDDVELGWYDAGTRNVLRTVTPATTDIFENIGFYADVRADGNGFAGADNLTIIPEPGSVALLGLGALGMIRRRRTA